MEIVKEIEKNTSLNKNEVEELIETIKEQEGYIFPSYIADKTGFLIEDVNKCLLMLCIYNYLNHYIVPQYQNKIYTEYARWGYSFSDHELMLQNIKGFYTPDDIRQINLLSAYKKHKFDK